MKDSESQKSTSHQSAARRHEAACHETSPKPFFGAEPDRAFFTAERAQSTPFFALKPSSSSTLQAKSATDEVEELNQPAVQRMPAFESEVTANDEVQRSLFNSPQHSSASPIQAKLTIGQPGDKYEQEADRVASQVVEQINAPATAQSTQRQSVQRQEEKPEELQAKPEITALQRQEEKPEELQAKSTLKSGEAIAGGEASSDLASAINSARGSGQPLDTSLQRSMGQAMGTDFSGVRVHMDTQSDQLNRSIQAKAFTTGQDVFFRQGAYEPGSRGGQELIAHELTHVVQQQGVSPNGQKVHLNAPTSGFISRGRGKPGQQGSTPAVVPNYTQTANTAVTAAQAAEAIIAKQETTVEQANAQIAIIQQQITQVQGLVVPAQTTVHKTQVNQKLQQVNAILARAQKHQQTKIAETALPAVVEFVGKAERTMKRAEESAEKAVAAAELAIGASASDAEAETKKVEAAGKIALDIKNGLLSAVVNPAETAYQVVLTASNAAQTDRATQAEGNAKTSLDAVHVYRDAIAHACDIAQAAIDRAKAIATLKQTAEQKAKALATAQAEAEARTQELATAQNEAQALNKKLLEAQAQSQIAKQVLANIRAQAETLNSKVQVAKSKADFMRRHAALAPSDAATLASARVNKAQQEVVKAEMEAAPTTEALTNLTVAEQQAASQVESANQAKQTADVKLLAATQAKQLAEDQVTATTLENKNAQQEATNQEITAHQAFQAAKDETTQTKELRTLAGDQPKLTGLLQQVTDKSELKQLLVAMGYSLLSECLKDVSIGLGKVRQIFATFGAQPLKDFASVTGANTGYDLIKDFSVQELKDLVDHPAIGAGGLNLLAQEVKIDAIKNYVSELTANKLGDLLSELTAKEVVFYIKHFTLEKVKDLVSKFTASELKPYLTDFTLVEIIDLVKGFTAQALKDYATTVGYNRLKVLVNDKKLKADVLQHYNAAWLRDFIGAGGTATAHIVNVDTRADNGVISGGHDPTVFQNEIDRVIHNGPPAVANGRINFVTFDDGNIRKVNYTTHNIDGTDWATGTKTLIIGLVANQALWQGRANEAVWESIRAKRFNPAQAAWSGTAENGMNFSGFYTNGEVEVRTYFPT